MSTKIYCCRTSKTGAFRCMLEKGHTGRCSWDIRPNKDYLKEGIALLRTQKLLAEAKFALSELSTHLEAVDVALYQMMSDSEAKEDSAYWRHEVKAHRRNIKLVSRVLKKL